MAMTNYPYPANFLEPMPAWPINEAVKAWADIPTKADLAKSKHMVVKAMNFVRKALSVVGIEQKTKKHGLSDREVQLLTALQNSTSVYFNYTGAYPCTNLSDWEGTGSLDGFGWNVLACNQLAMPISFNENSMFIPQDFDYDSYTALCQKQFGLTPDYEWALRFFGGYNIDKDFLA